MSASLASCGGGGGGGGSGNGGTLEPVSGTVVGLEGTGLLIQLNNAVDLQLTANGTFSFSSKITEGSTYLVSIATQPTALAQQCTVSNASGTVTGPITNVAISCVSRVPMFLFASAANVINTYSLDASDGAISRAPISTTQTLLGAGPEDVVADASGTYLFASYRLAANPPSTASSIDVTSFSIESSTGILTPRTSVSVGAAKVVVDPASRFLYTIGFAAIDQYAIGTNGSLALVDNLPSSDFAALAIDPQGQFLFGALPVQSAVPAGISVFQRSSSTGNLTLTSNKIPAVTGNPTAIAVDPTGRFVYLGTAAASSTGATPSTLYAYALTRSSGALSQVGGAQELDGYILGSYMAVDPSGRFLYVVSSAGAEVGILGYTINQTTGALGPIAGVFAPNTSVANFSIDPGGRFLYTNTGETFTINATTGALTPDASAANQLGGGIAAVGYFP